MPEPLLRVEDLRIRFATAGGPLEVVHGVSFKLPAGGSLGLVGESGAGKSLSALAIAGLLPPAAEASGRIRISGRDVLSAAPETLREIRGRRVGFVFQEPQTALNPVLPIGVQVAETVRAHRDLSRSEARREALRLLERVALADPARRFGAYPHQLSGGQRQRVVLATALAGQPDLLIADEPTTALDVTVQAQILDLLRDLRGDLGLALLLITHDLGVIGRTCERVVVLYAGRVVEELSVERLFERPSHPYTRGLLSVAPRLGAGAGSGPISLPGTMPSPGALPGGCAFHPRCPEALEVCPSSVPQPRSADGGSVACHLYPES